MTHDFTNKSDREELHGILKRTIEGHRNNIKLELTVNSLKCIELLIETQERIIEDQEERIAIMSEGGWIPVEERLPEIKEGKEYFGTECIVCDKWKQVFVLRYCKHIVRGKEIYRWMRYDMSIYYGEVVYWMPFPEPPKEGGAE